MTASELPPEDDADQPDERHDDDVVDESEWDMSGQLNRSPDDGQDLLEEGDPDAVPFGELRDDAEPDTFSALGSVDSFRAEEDPQRDVPIRELERVWASGPLDIWPTRRAREAEIMGYAADADYDTVEQGRCDAEEDTTAQVSEMYERAGFLVTSDAAQRAAVADPSAEDDGTRTWFTTTGRVSIRQHTDFNYDDQSIRERLHKNEDQAAFGVLEVQSQETVPYGDDGGFVNVNVRLTYETVENGRVYWKGMQTGFTNPEDGSPCPEGEEALIGSFDPEDLPPGVSLDRAIEHKLLNYVWHNTDEVFSAFANEDEEGDVTAEDMDAVQAQADETSTAIEAEMAEAATDGPSVRDQALYAAGQEFLAYERSATTEHGTYDVANAYVDIIKAASRMDDSATASGFCGLLEGVGDVSNDKLAAAYFAASSAGDAEMLTKIDTLLTSETIARMQDKTNPGSHLGMEGLQQIILEYEARGLSPDSLIEERTLSAEERWVLTVYHQERTKGEDPERAAAQLRTIRQLATNGIQAFSPEFVIGMTSSALGMCGDQTTREQLMGQFIEAIDQVAPSSNTYRRLLNVGNQVLQDQELREAGYAQRINTALDIQLKQLPGDYAKLRDKRLWDVNAVAHADTTSQELIASIRQSTEWSIANTTHEPTKQALAADEGTMMGAGARAYAQQRQFAYSRELIAEVGMAEQAEVYETCLRYAKSPLDLERLRPVTDAGVMAHDPDITMMFSANQARISGDVTAMHAEVAKLAEYIATSKSGDMESQQPDAARCRTQAVDLISRMRALRPGSEIPATRALLQGMQKSVVYRADLTMLSLSFDSLIESGDPADHAFVFKVIADAHASAAKKAAQFARLGLSLTD